MKEFKFEGYGFSVNKLVPNGDTHIALPMEVIRKACRKSDALSKFMWFNNIRIFDSKPLNIKTLRPVPMYDDEPTAFFDWSMCEDALSYILLLTLNSLCKEKYNQEFFYYAPSRQSSSPDEKVESFILFQAGYPWELSKRFPTSREEVDNLIMDGIHQILGDVVDVEIKEWHIVYSTGLSTVDEERKSEAHSTVNDTKKTDEKFMPAAGVPEEASPAASVSDDDEYQLKFAFYPGELTSLDKLPNNPCCYEVTSDEPITTSDLTSTIRYAIEVNGFDRGKFSCITTEWLNTEVVLKTLWLIHDVHVVRSHVPSQLVQWREDEQPTIFAVNWEKSGFRFHDVANL